MIQFSGAVTSRRGGEGALGLTLSGRAEDRPDETVHIAFTGRAPVGLPERLDSVRVEQVAPRRYTLSSSAGSWILDGTAHVHRDVAAAFYRALPPRPVPLGKRVFWRVLLALAANPAGRWLLSRAR